MPIVTIDSAQHKVPEGTRLGVLLARGREFEMPCGGHGRCGKCKVTVKGKVSSLTDRERGLLSGEEIGRGVRLACLATVEGDCHIYTANPHTSDRYVMQDNLGICCETYMQPFGSSGVGIQQQGEGHQVRLHPSFAAYGCAVDIGTTTLAACLYDTKGEMLACAGSRNPQAGWGADVISRIDAALEGAGQELAAAVCKAVDELLIRLAEKSGILVQEIDGLVVTGNTVMLHLLTDTCLEPLSHAPFAVQRRFGETVEAGSLGLKAVQPDTPVYLPPCISAFIGADLVTALLASGICEASGTQLLVDIGTNGEMALIKKGQLFVCSTAAGPAFEGAGVSQGMQGKRGAIDRVFFRNGELEVHTIGETDAVGICGSGIVDAIACLLESARVDETGYMEEGRVRISSSVAITQNDVRMVQLAKGAIHAGICTLLHEAGAAFEEISVLYIAGGFGSYLNVENAGRIGLVPEELVPKVRVIGNAALSGASMLLLNQEYCTACAKYAEWAKRIELSNNSFFSEEYMAKMMF